MSSIQKYFQLLFFLIISAYAQTTTSSCASKWRLPNLVQTTHTFVMSPTADPKLQTFTFTYGSSYFDGRPTPIISFTNYNCPSFSQLNYTIDHQINDTQITINFHSQNMKWSSAKLTLWMTSRSDLITGTIVGQNFQPGQTKYVTTNTPALISYHTDNRTIYLNFINSMIANSSVGAYNVSVRSFGKTENNYTVEIVSGNETNLVYIKLNYVIYNLELSLFSSGGGYRSSTPLTSRPAYNKVHKNFIPINYKMIGIDKVVLNNTFQLYLNIDQDYILQAWSNSGIPKLEIVYLTIGQKTDIVCTECDRFIYQDNCLADCPNNTYPYFGYEIGGKSCLTCSEKVYEELKPDRTGCKCMSGYAFNDLGICVGIETNIIPDTPGTLTEQAICGNNQINENGLCICDRYSVQTQSGCEQCPEGSYKSGSICSVCPSACIKCFDENNCQQCISNFVLNPTSGQCDFNDQLTCALNEVDVNGQCVCANGYYRISDVCSTCPQGTIYDPAAQACRSSIICGDLEVNNGDQCICSARSIRVNGVCTLCNDGEYKQNQNLCLPCIDKCVNCQNNTFCNACIGGYIYNQTTNICDPIGGFNNITCDIYSILVNGRCERCNAGSFKLGTQCELCSSKIPYCSYCVDGTKCLECISGFDLNLVNGICCGVNQFYNSDLRNCECTRGYYNVSQNCVQCPVGYQYDSNKQQCFQKIDLSNGTGIIINQNTTTQTNNTVSRNETNTTQKVNITNTTTITNENTTRTNTTNTTNPNINNNNTNPNSNNTNNNNTNNTNNNNNTDTNIVPPYKPDNSLTVDEKFTGCPQNQVKLKNSNYGCVCRKNYYWNGIKKNCQTCPDGQYKNFQNFTDSLNYGTRCSYCRSKNCRICTTDESRCTECLPGYQLTEDRQCIDANIFCDNINSNQCLCKVNTIKNDGGTCQSCPQNNYVDLLTNKCKQDVCGNKIKLHSDEDCDDGNNANGDGCDSNCKVQPGYVCYSFGCSKILDLPEPKFTSSGIIQPLIINNETLITVSSNDTEGISPQKFVLRKDPKATGENVPHKILLDYCGVPPSGETSVYYTMNTPKGYTTVKSVYNTDINNFVPEGYVPPRLE